MAATEGMLQAVSLPAAADLSAKQYYFVEIDANGRIDAVDAQGAKAIGVLQDKPAAIDRVGNVAFSGITKVVLDSTVAVGADVTSTATGTAETAASGDYILGTCIKGGVASEVGSILLSIGGRVA